MKSSLAKVWCRVKFGVNSNTQFSERAIKILLPFPTSYLPEAGIFFLIHFNQNNIINRMNAEASMKIRLSYIKPYIKEICKNVKQCYPSH